MAGKLCWALGLVLLFAAAVLTQAPLAVGLLGFFLLLTLLLALEVRYLRGKVEAELVVPTQPAVQGQPFVLTVRLTNRSPLPIPQLLTLVQAADTWGGSTITLRCSGMLGGSARAEQRLTLRADKSGMWDLQLQSVTLWDHLGLFKAQCGVPQPPQSLCVLPQSARLGSDTQPDPDADGTQESDRSVLGGSYDVREYREGDSLKQVHWKLSAKLNRLLIREPLATGTMAGKGSGNGPGEGDGDAWGDFPAEAALHREAPPTKKKAVALSKRGGTDADSGLVFLDRVLISPAVPARDTLWLVVDLCLLLALAFGLVSAAVTAFAVTPPVWVWLALAAWCAGWCLFGRLPRRGQRLGLLAGSLVYLVGLFLCQRSFLAGARQFGAAVAASLNERFNANLAAAAGGTPAQLGLFLALAALPLVGLLALAALRRADILLLNLLLLPAAVFLLLAGSAVSTPCCLLLAVGWLGALAASRAVRRRALWGAAESETNRRNQAQHRAIQKGSAAATVLVCAALLVPAFVLRPLVSLPLQALQPAARVVESAAISAAVTWLPRVSGGRLNLHVEAAAGGVADGALGQGGGLQLRGVEDLALTASEQPKETVYLRGFIGGSYDGTAWQAPDAAAFDSAAMNWKTEDDARLTIASLAFLRAAYDGTAEPQSLTVERLNAGDAYTYAPYNAYWNDYYTLNGDGAADGQTVQDDVFLYYPRSIAKELLATRDEGDPSVLDRMENSYAAYADSHYTAVPDGYDDLLSQCAAAAKDQKLTDPDDIAAYIRTWLNTNCQYDTNAPQAPDGTDPIHYFLYESKSGYSVQFASAATLMFRMFGLPARYVVGYAAPQSLFTRQADGSWHAVLQDDNAHAWAEVYIDGQGWTPMEMTPGVLVTAEKADYKSDLPETTPTESEAAADSADTRQSLQPSAAPRSALWLLAVLVVVLAAAAAAFILHRRRVLGLDTRRPCAERVLAIFAAIYAQLVRRGLPAGTSSDEQAFTRFMLKEVQELSGAESEVMVSLAQRAAFAADTLTEEDVTTMRNWYKRLKGNKKA